MVDVPTTKLGPLYTVGRYALTAAGIVIAAAGAVGVLDATSVASATQAIQNIADAAGKIATALTMLVGLGAAAYATIRGALNSTAPAQIAAVQAMANDPETPVRAVLLEPSPAGHDLRADLPGPGIVLAGTPAALVAIKA